MGAESERPMGPGDQREWGRGPDSPAAAAASVSPAAEPAPIPPEELSQLRATLAELASGLARVTEAVDRLSARESMTSPEPPPASGSAAPPEGAASAPVPGPQAPSYQGRIAVPAPGPWGPRTSQPEAATAPAAPAAPQWPVPVGAVVPGAPGTTRPAGAVIPGSYPATATYAAPPPAFAAATPPTAQRSSWADTSGLKILGWVGGGVTVLGVVMLLVIAAQQGYFGPVARVMLGVVLGAVLIGGGYLLHRRPEQAGLATTVVATGLAAEYLSTVGAVRLVDLAPPLVGHIASAVIAGIGVLIAWSWRSPYLAAAAFLVSTLLAPVVGVGYSVDVYVFELVMVAAGAAGLLIGAGIAVWGGAAIGAAFTVLIGLAVRSVEVRELWLMIVMMVVAWGLFVGRAASGRTPLDPGPFPIRPRSADPAQVARDYADFHAHEQRRAAARTDRVAAVTSMAVSAALVALAIANVGFNVERNFPAGITAVVLALLTAAVAWAAGAEMPGSAARRAGVATAERAGSAAGAHAAAPNAPTGGADGSPRMAALNATSMRVTAWSSAILFAAVALARLLEGDLRSVSWLVLAAVVLVIVAVERLSWMLLPALVAGAVALMAAAPALSPSDLFEWPSTGLIAGGAVARRAWTVVFPAGICVLALAAVAWWATARVTAAGVARARGLLAEREAAGLGHDRSAADLREAEQRRTGQMAGALIACAVVACYGLLAVTMVLSYAASPTFTGYQVGQIVVTGFVTVLALVLLWQGFRTMLVRLGGLGLAAVAVGKLLFFDTRTLDSLPRAMTVIGVGVLLLIGAVVYLRALRRATAPVAGSAKGPHEAVPTGAVPTGAVPGGVPESH